MDIKETAKLAFKNRAAIEKSTSCWCYGCVRTFGKEEIKEWTDDWETALCPHCSVDSVIPNTSLELNEKQVRELQKFWF